MKSILLPTDFSEISDNALRYALEIAKALKTEVVFFHANHIPVIAPNTPVGVYDNLIVTDDKKQKEALVSFKNKIYQETGITEAEVPSRCIVKLGFAVDEIEAIAEEENIGLIALGTHGASGLQKALIGSIAASVVKKSKCPVLAIPAGAVFQGINKIALATDFHHLENKITISPLLEMALLFNSEVLIFNVRKDKANMPTFEEAVEGMDLEEILQDIDHSFHISENNDITKGIEEFVKNQNADILAMIPHPHSFWDSLFTTSYTEEIALDAVVPLLTLPEKRSNV